ncbi:hypothetical protein [Wohlfahrtiimonas larvae]|uniref:Uncharacterized protein n=1 Tax=Wohlfahrtiimonas larvae TaxID=1157986 RepID=A0ABP9MM34_9GAMM|nr:hypothetical protein [Wohlfahrtiimonas larvae]
MFKKLCIVTLVVASLNYANAVEIDETHASILPEDVQLLLKKSQECAYWIDQWDHNLDEPHKKHIEINVNNICFSIIEERTHLMEKYKDSPEILEHLQ